MAETAYRSWKAAVPKKTHNKYRELNDRREDMKKRYQLLPRLEYLKTMGHLLHNITTKISEHPVKHTSKKTNFKKMIYQSKFFLKIPMRLSLIKR